MTDAPHPAAPGTGLVIQDLSVAYDHRLVLDGVSVACAHGEILGLLGPNGAGKSTLLKAIVGLVPRAGGSIGLDGMPLGRGGAPSTRLAYVPQRHEVDWDFPLTVEDVVLLGRQGRLGLLGRPGKADRQAAHAALERLGMGPQRRALIGELSGGQQQRVFLARALAQEGDVLLLDEPLTGVDATTQAIVLDLLADLRSRGLATVLATHDLAEAARVCDRLCLLNGRVMAFGPPHEVLTTDALVRTYGSSGIGLNRDLGEEVTRATLGPALPHDAGPAGHPEHEAAPAGRHPHRRTGR
ncbi:MAG: metal ABC transporter ATP-binding protein [Chloroflexi bacterium]|nr:metal ABC transporter ATP-binding protein [Chloroflexota bacterium]